MELKLWIARDKAVIPEDMQHFRELTENNIMLCYI